MKEPKRRPILSFLRPLLKSAFAGGASGDDPVARTVESTLTDAKTLIANSRQETFAELESLDSSSRPKKNKKSPQLDLPYGTEGRVRELTMIAGIGFEKCGTTSLSQMLKSNNKFSVPERKELFFFSANYADDVSAFLAHHCISSNTKFLVDITPSYIQTPEPLDRLRSWPMKKKILICVRDPIDRAFAHYVHRIYWHHAHYDPEIQDYLETPIYSNPYQKTFAEELEQPTSKVLTLYADLVEQAFTFFGRENCEVLILERDFEQKALNERLSNFLGEEILLSPVPQENVGGYLPVIRIPEGTTLHTDEGDMSVTPRSVYAFLSPKHGICYWEDVTSENRAKILDASSRWTATLQENEVAALRQWFFGGDIQRMERLLGTNLDVWRRSKVLSARRWTGLGSLKEHKQGQFVRLQW